MNIFIRDKLFEQFLPVTEGEKELEVDKKMVITGHLKVFQTSHTTEYVKRFCENIKMKLTKERVSALKYEKIQGVHDVVLIYNKNDCSILISISRRRRR